MNGKHHGGDDARSDVVSSEKVVATKVRERRESLNTIKTKMAWGPHDCVPVSSFQFSAAKETKLCFE
jgi:hypothetical protein